MQSSVDNLAIAHVLGESGDLLEIKAANPFKIRAYRNASETIASVHSAFGLGEEEMTDRILRAIESPAVDVIGHPTGRLLLRREPYQVDRERLVDAAACLGGALEINCRVDRLDLNDVNARLARERKVKLVISTDSHSPTSFDLLNWGVLVTRLAWAEPGEVLNTLPVDQLRAGLRRNRCRP